MNLDKIISGMFGLIILFLLLTRAGELNSIVRSVGGFITSQTQALQGVSGGGLIQSSNVTAASFASPFGG